MMIMLMTVTAMMIMMTTIETMMMMTMTKIAMMMAMMRWLGLMQGGEFLRETKMWDVKHPAPPDVHSSCQNHHKIVTNIIIIIVL